MMAGLLQATEGSIWMDDVDMTKNPRLLRTKIGYMPDFFGVYDNLKVTEYMDFYAGTYEIPYKDRKDIIDGLLDIVDLSHKKEAYVDSLSRGMKQRLCLARSLIHDPKLLILDEPASGLCTSCSRGNERNPQTVTVHGENRCHQLTHLAGIGGDVYRSGYHQSGKTGSPRDGTGNHAAVDPETHHLCASFGGCVQDSGNPAGNACGKRNHGKYRRSGICIRRQRGNAGGNPETFGRKRHWNRVFP